MNKFDTIIFDLDSTLVTMEGLDWLAEYKGKGEKVRELTAKSMAGLLSFNEAMIEKMKIISPSYMDMLALGSEYCKNIVDGAGEVISKFYSLGINVWILTGNFEPAVGILAKKLNIGPNRVICNKIFFGKYGEYIGFNENNNLSKNGGKAKEVIFRFKGRKVLFVGDSVTDLEVKKHVKLFVGFGGVVEREVVRRNADYYISEPSLKPLIEVLYL